MYNFIDLEKQRAAPGVGAYIYLIPVKWILTFGAINSTNSVVPGASVIMDTAIVPITGKGFIKIYTTQSASDLVGEAAGENDSETMDFKLNLQHPGVGPVMAEFIKEAQGTDFIAIVKSADCINTTPWLVGTNCSPLTLKFSTGTGQPNSGSNATKIVGTWFHPYPLFYSAAIPLLPVVEGGGE